MNARSQQWDIFCRVVDNFGDIGVCWRLARQLSREYGLQVRLWVDDLGALAKLNPSADFTGVEVQHWPDVFPETSPADVVIEAFACELPANYLAAMVSRPPLWINLEYLTAEPWAAEAHGLPSPHPTLPLTKYFFFPGFTPNTGGLLREKNLGQDLDAARRLGFQSTDGAINISLFGYENGSLNSLLDAWTQGAEPVVCWVPEGRLLPQLTAYFGQSLAAGMRLENGGLSLHVLPFLSQDDFDQLLWACDLNFVRGEDSFVRAQWTAKPFVWQIYPQAEAAHIPKLEAFLGLYCQDLPQQVATFWRDWNAGASVDWLGFWQYRAAMQAQALTWQNQLMNQADLASKLVNFHKNHI